MEAIYSPSSAACSRTVQILDGKVETLSHRLSFHTCAVRSKLDAQSTDGTKPRSIAENSLLLEKEVVVQWLPSLPRGVLGVLVQYRDWRPHQYILPPMGSSLQIAGCIQAPCRQQPAHRQTSSLRCPPLVPCYPCSADASPANRFSASAKHLSAEKSVTRSSASNAVLP